jgi:hypothetical protein
VLSGLPFEPLVLLLELARRGEPEMIVNADLFGSLLLVDQINRYLRSSPVRRGEATPEGDDFLARGGTQGGGSLTT